MNGVFPFDDLKWVLNGSDLSVELVKFDANGDLADIDCFYEQIRKSDLLVIPWEGSLINRFIERNKHDNRFQQLVASTDIKRVAWSMDTHHQWQVEQMCQKYFHTYYTAHSDYLNKFEAVKGVWLPCYWQFGGREELWKLSNVKQEKTCDIVSIYRSYLNIGDRNIVAAKCMHYLENKQLSHFLGSVSHERYCQALLAGKVVLNISIIDDLNMRNFEAIGLNQILLTNKVSDHDKVSLDYRNTVFFKRDASDFPEALDKALALSQSARLSTVENILNHHMLIHRYVEMFNRELGLSLRVLPFEKTVLPNELKQSFSIDLSAGDVVFSPVEVSLKAVWNYLNLGDAKSAFSELQWLSEQNSEKLKDHQEFILQLFIRVLQMVDTANITEYQVLLQTMTSAVLRKSIETVMKNATLNVLLGARQKLKNNEAVRVLSRTLAQYTLRFAVEFYSRGDSEKSKEFARITQELDSAGDSTGEATYLLAQIALLENQIDIALNLWKQVSELFPNTARSSEAKRQCVLLGIKKAQLLAKNQEQNEIDQLLAETLAILEA
jgi:hypothetical protein